MSTPPVAIWGAGGHGKVVYDIVTSMGYEVVAWLDETSPGGSRYGVPILGPDPVPVAQQRPGLKLVVAIGNNAARARIFRQLRQNGHPLLTAVHVTAIVHKTVQIGTGTVVMPGAIINIDSVIGENCIVNTGAIIEHDCHVSDHVHVGPGSRLTGAVGLGEGTFVGAGATVLPGLHIGCWATVGAGAVVTRDLADGVTAVGVPARSLTPRV